MLAVADGVGGRAGGAVAAQMVADAAFRLAGDPKPFLADRLGWLAALDSEIERHPSAGETAAVVAVLTETQVSGIAVGDSAAWHIGPGHAFTVLSAGSEPKPWLGSGAPVSRAFDLSLTEPGWLLLATDGLLKYATPPAIRDVVRTAPFQEIPPRLLELVRRPSSGYIDDVAVIAAKWEQGDERQQERE